MSACRFSQILSFLLFFFFFASSAISDTPRDREIATLKKTYLKLRNTDPEIEKRSEWEGLIQKLLKFEKKNPSHTEAPWALFRASILYSQLFNVEGKEDYADKQVEILKRIYSNYGESDIAVEARLKRGDVLLYILGNENEAREEFEYIVEESHSPDTTELARIRLRQLKGTSVEKGKISPSADSSGIKIVIDPGHGGEDNGAEGSHGLREKDIVYDISIKLEKMLVKELGAHVAMTRRGDHFIPLAERTQFANDFNADLFISLHVNASPGGIARGFEVYYLDNSDDQASKKLAERENTLLGTVPSPVTDDLQFMLSDLIQSAKLESSMAFADFLSRSVVSYLRASWKNVISLGVKKAPFYVLVGAHMPCVLVEMFFINNKLDSKRLADREFRADVARGLFMGIRDYVKSTDFHKSAYSSVEGG